LPEVAIVADLPAFDGFGGGFVAGVGSELMGAGPAPDAGAVGFEVETPVEFAGGGAVGGGRFGGEEFGEERRHFGGPVRMMIATGDLRRPKIGTALGISPQVVGAQTVEVAQMNVEFLSARDYGKQAGANLFENVPAKGAGQR
jgi:hypothetical protein